MNWPRLRNLIKRGTFQNRIKGQYMEELVESQIVPWLHTRPGSFALGVPYDGRKLEFWPGGLILDADGKKVSDGMLIIRDKKVFDAPGFFETKNISVVSDATGGFEKPTRSSIKEAKSYANDLYEEELELAKKQNRPYNKTLADIHRELNLPTEGGQVRRTIERLYPNADKKPYVALQFGGQIAVVRISPSKVKTFVVGPKDIDPRVIANISAEAKSSHLNIELITPNITSRELNDAADDIVKLGVENIEW